MGPMKIFYGWRVVAAACGIQFLLAALMVQSFGLYVAVLAEDMGWSKTALAGGAALQSAETALLGPMLGWLLDRFGPRRMIRTGMVCLGAGLWLLSQVQSLPVFYASAVLMSVGTSLSGYFPLSIAVVHWFEKQRARALSMMTVGLAVGGLMSPLLAWSMQHLGWRETAMVAGTLAWRVGLPLAGLIRHRPAELGPPRAPRRPMAARPPAPCWRRRITSPWSRPCAHRPSGCWPPDMRWRCWWCQR